MKLTAADPHAMPALMPDIHTLETPAISPGLTRTGDRAHRPVGRVAADKSLAILHVFRAPVGGLFRHGLVADATTGGARAEAALAELAPTLALGVRRVAMSRHLGLRDVTAVREVARAIRASGADIVHGHGAKGGAYARLAGTRALRAYTPHGGTLHFDPRSPLGFVYLNLERALKSRTDLILFESAYARAVFDARIGVPGAPAPVVHNGVGVTEFTPVAPTADASDLVFVGELRHLKGVDVLIEALGLLAASGRRVSATIVGSGPEAAEFQAFARARGLADVTFPGALPAREAFARGRILVVPSRAESLPYIVLEAAAAGVPMLATNVGGIPEIFGPHNNLLLPAGDPARLADAIALALDDPDRLRAAAQALRERVRAAFSAETMVERVMAAYQAAAALRAVR